MLLEVVLISGFGKSSNLVWGMGHWVLGMEKRQGRWADKAETCSIIPPCLLTAAALAAQSPIPNPQFL